MFALKAIFVLFALVSVVHASRWRTTGSYLAYLNKHLPNNRFLKDPDVKRAIIPLMGKIIFKGGCNPNVCFALDGSGSVNSDDFRAQKEFVELAAALIGVDRSAHFASVQYTRTLHEISPLTNNQDSFLVRVNNARAKGGATFVPAGLAYCVKELYHRREDANKIVLLGDGRNNFGSGSLTGPLRRFRGEVCAVGVGNINKHNLIKIAGHPSRVFQADDFFSLAFLIDDLVSGICKLH